MANTLLKCNGTWNLTECFFMQILLKFVKVSASKFFLNSVSELHSFLLVIRLVQFRCFFHIFKKAHRRVLSWFFWSVWTQRIMKFLWIPSLKALAYPSIYSNCQQKFVELWRNPQESNEWLLSWQHRKFPSVLWLSLLWAIFEQWKLSSFNQMKRILSVMSSWKLHFHNPSELGAKSLSPLSHLELVRNAIEFWNERTCN